MLLKALLLSFATPVYTARKNVQTRVKNDAVLTFSCNQAPMCDCNTCNPETCIVFADSDGKKCKWPDSHEWCESWLKDQCAPPSRPKGGGLGALIADGKLPLPGMAKPGKEVKEEPPAEMVEETGSVVNKPSDDEIIKKVRCDLAPICDCGNCNPDTCILTSPDGDRCMWPPSADYCVKWKADQCATPEIGRGKAGGGLAGLLASGKVPLPGFGHSKPKEPTPEPTATIEKPPIKEVIKKVNCNHAPMCDCGNCNPETCILNSPDGDRCMWPPSADYCVRWKKDQCATPEIGRGKPSPLAGLLTGGKVPLPGFGHSKPKEPTPEPTAIVKKPPIKEVIKKVSCNHAPMCDCGNCNPETCILNSPDGDQCMWPPSADYCVRWKKDQCATPEIGRRKPSPLAGLLTGGKVPLRGSGHSKPKGPTPEPTATVEKSSKPWKMPQPSGGSVERLKPVTQKATPAPPEVDANSVCQSLDLSKSCSTIHKRLCPIACAKFQ